MTVTDVPIASLKPAEYNPRTLSTHDFDSLTRSLKTFGFVEPVVINTFPGRERVVIGGHQRLKAALALGLTTAPVIEVSLPLHQEQLLNLALNRVSGEWDEQKLTELIYTVSQTPDANLLLSGFTQKELTMLATEGMLRRPFGAEERSSVSPDAGPPTSTLGEVYQLGRHRLMCGDATNPAHVGQLCEGVTPTLCLTDPPYSVDYKTRKRVTDGAMESYEDPHEAGVLLEGFLAALPCRALVMTYGDKRLFDAVEALKAQGWSLVDMLVWVKQHFTYWPGARYQQQHELVWCCVKGGATLPSYTEQNQSTVLTYDRKTRNAIHPTEKPMDLWQRLLANHSQIGDVIYDPFLGSGTTLLAAELLNRTCVGMEISPYFCDLIRSRYETMVKDAVHV